MGSLIRFGGMKPLACISVLSLFIAGCVSHPPAQTDAYFLPCAARAAVSFKGETQAGGREVHRLEVRRLAYVLPTTKQERPTMGSCAIYYAGADTHIRQQWKLLGYTAKLEKQEAIDWSEDPRMKADAEQTGSSEPRDRVSVAWRTPLARGR